MIIRGLWDHQFDTIIDFKLGDADADTYKYEPMTSLLSRWEEIKIYKHGKNCNNQHKHFSTFFISVERMLGREALIMISQLSRVMAEKKVELLSQVRGVGKRTHCNRRFKVLLTSPLQEREPGWDPESKNRDGRLNCTSG